MCFTCNFLIDFFFFKQKQEIWQLGVSLSKKQILADAISKGFDKMWHSLCSSSWAPHSFLCPDHFSDLCWLLSTAKFQFCDFCITPYCVLEVSKIEPSMADVSGFMLFKKSQLSLFRPGYETSIFNILKCK